MPEYLPVLLVAGIIGLFAIAFIIAYARLKANKNYKIHENRNMSDKVIVRRLLGYAKPYW